METYAREHWASKGVEVVAYPSYTNAYVDVTAGRLDATFQEAQSAVEGFLDKPEGADYELAAMMLDDPILNKPIGRWWASARAIRSRPTWTRSSRPCWPTARSKAMEKIFRRRPDPLPRPVIPRHAA